MTEPSPSSELAEDWRALKATLANRIVPTARGLRWHRPVEQGDGDYESAATALAFLTGRAQGIEDGCRERIDALEAEITRARCVGVQVAEARQALHASLEEAMP
jgi:hypothetical protein